MARLDRPLNPRGSRVLPAGWEEHHRHIPDATATATVRLHAGTDPEWVYDPDAGADVRDLGPVLWEGLARVQQLNRTTTSPAGTQQVTVHEYLVTVPRHVPAGEWVQVVESGDPELDLLRVVDVLKGSLRWERDLITTDNLEGA